MAITVTNKDNGTATNTGTTQATASVAFANNKLYLVAVPIRSTDGTSRTVTGITGGGLTWVEIVETPNNNHSMALYRGLVTSGATTEALTITFSSALGANGRVCWSINELDGMDTSGTDGSGAIVQSDARAAGNDVSYAGVLAAFADGVNNVCFSAVSHTGNEVTTHEGTFTEITDVFGATQHLALCVQYKVGEDTSPSASWVTNTFRGSVAAEIKAATTAPSLIIPRANRTRHMLIR